MTETILEVVGAAVTWPITTSVLKFWTYKGGNVGGRRGFGPFRAGGQYLLNCKTYVSMAIPAAVAMEVAEGFHDCQEKVNRKGATRTEAMEYR